MAPKTITDELTVDGQLKPEDMAELASQGFKTVFCARPDGEEPGQPDCSTMKAAAEAAGLEFVSVPVDPKTVTMADVAVFSDAMEDLPKPIYGYCRSGKRVVSLWALSQAEDEDADDLIECAAKAGFDIEELRPRIEMLS